MRWYLVQTKNGQEPLAERNLQQQGYETFLPAERRQVRHARKTKIVRAAFFPGYLFVCLDIATQRWRPINSTYGVTRIIAADDGPVQVPDMIVADLQRHRTAEGYIERADTLGPGDKLTVQFGPFAGLTGRIAAVTPRDRLKVLLDAMNNPFPIEIDRRLVRKLAAC